MKSKHQGSLKLDHNEFGFVRFDKPPGLSMQQIPVVAFRPKNPPTKEDITQLLNLLLRRSRPTILQTNASIEEFEVLAEQLSGEEIMTIEYDLRHERPASAINWLLSKSDFGWSSFDEAKFLRALRQFKNARGLQLRLEQQPSSGFYRSPLINKLQHFNLTYYDPNTLSFDDEALSLQRWTRFRFNAANSEHQCMVSSTGLNSYLREWTEKKREIDRIHLDLDLTLEITLDDVFDNITGEIQIIDDFSAKLTVNENRSLYLFYGFDTETEFLFYLSASLFPSFW